MATDRIEENTASLASVIQLAIHNALKDLHTSTPGIVQSFDPATQTARVQPTIKRLFRTSDGETETVTAVDLPLLINVPVVFPRGGGFSLTFPVTAGDECLIIFAERSIDSWHEFGTVAAPSAKRFHALSDAVAFVGLSSKPHKVPSYSASSVQIKADDGSATIDIVNNVITISSGAEVTVNTPTATINADTINTSGDAVNVTASTVTIDAALTTMTGDLIVSGDVTNGAQITLGKHKHVAGSGGKTGGPIP